METILLMLSGGVDSTCLLYYYLTETKHPIHAHHISIRYPHLQRWKMEDPAVKKIVDHCRRAYRHFDYSESRFDLGPMGLVGWDQTLQLLVASKVAPNLPGEKVTIALGHCYDDFDSPAIQEIIRLKTMHKLWMALRESCINKGERLNPERGKPFVDLKWTKEEICRRMPAELMRLCWSCRRPEYINGEGLPCGSCKTCRQIETILDKSGQTEEFPNLVRPKHLARHESHEQRSEEHQGHMPTSPASGYTRPPSMASRHPSPTQARQGAPTPNQIREHSPAFRIKVALAALNNEKNGAQIAIQYGVDPAIVNTWKQMLLDGMTHIFTNGPGTSVHGNRGRKIQEEIDSLNRRVQRLEVQLRDQPDAVTVRSPIDNEF